MANVVQLPCDGDGLCMRCKTKPPTEETISCCTCVTPWHVSCLIEPLQTLASSLSWVCPDCSGLMESVPSGSAVGGGDLVAAIRAIEADETLTEREKARKRQELVSGRVEEVDEEDEKKRKRKGKGKASEDDVWDLLLSSFDCSFCMQLLERPVTTPCGHNFCLKCFQKWTRQGKHTCAKCRNIIPLKMAKQPRINSALVAAIRTAKLSKLSSATGPQKVCHFVHNQDRPDTAFTTDRAQKAGKANAASGKIFVTVPPDHFGPIPAENDPERHRGVHVGDCWADRLDCRQWGAHLPHVAGIAGQSSYGAQSVALSGGYEDDEDHGEWFLYTGSGGRDLSGNKRTNKEQSFDQKFEKMNEALRVSCKMGYPVRVVRSHKEKRSVYAPEKGVRYDGVYRIEKCWRKSGIQGFKVCRYLFVRCDNEPAPWTSDEYGDRPRSLPFIEELGKATDIFERRESPSWDFDNEGDCWKWQKPPPPSQKRVNTGNPEDRKRSREVIKQVQNATVTEKIAKNFSCLICRQVLTLPITTPCGHNFCKACLEGAFAGQSFVKERSRGGRTLRSTKNIMLCPACPTDISECLQNPQVNREITNAIESVKQNAEPAEDLNEEEINEIEENPDPTSGENESAGGSSEEGGVKDDLPNPPDECEPKRACKRKKVDGEENKVSEKPGVSEGDSEVKEVQLGNPEGVMEDLQVPAAKQVVGAQTRSMKNQVAVEEGDSPLSTLQIQSSDEDFE
ncbi:hypothetical protein ACOSQ2_026116 [Xanthoceras sorbifolium]